MKACLMFLLLPVVPAVPSVPVLVLEPVAERALLMRVLRVLRATLLLRRGRCAVRTRRTPRCPPTRCRSRQTASIVRKKKEIGAFFFNI